MAGDLVISTINGVAIGTKNVIIDGNFNVNQRGVSGTVTLAAGAYGHDRWKGGASGCTYTFATVANVTTLTISAGSLVQVVEGLNLQSGTYTLSFSGTAQGKINGGSFSASGVTGTATGGTNMTIEFNTGTLSLVQLEKGSTATAFDYRPYGTELALCQRYYYKTTPGAGIALQGAGVCFTTTQARTSISFVVPMRTSPSSLEQSGTASDYAVLNNGGWTTCSAVPSFSTGSTSAISVTFAVASGLTAGGGVISRAETGTGYLGWSAEL